MTRRRCAAYSVGPGDDGAGARDKSLCRRRPERPRARSDGDRAAREATWIHPRATPAEILPYEQEGAARSATNKGSSPSGGAGCSSRLQYLGAVKDLNRLSEFFLRRSRRPPAGRAFTTLALWIKSDV